MNKLNIKSLNELMLKEYLPQRWLIDGIIPQDGLVMMSAAPASYKTWLMLQVALSVAKGEKFINAFDTEQAKVLIIDEESGERSLQERFKRLGATNDLPIHYLSRDGKKVSEKYIEELVATCKEKEIKLVMFDSFIRFAVGSENDSIDMARNMELFKKITDNGIACLILHHNRKSGAFGGSVGEAMRGSGDILAACDVHVALKRKEDKITISQTKNRYCEEIDPITVRFANEGETSKFQYLGKDKSKEEWDEELKESIVQHITDCPGLNKSQLLRDFKPDGKSVPANKFGNIISELEEDGRIRTEQGVKHALLLFACDEEAKNE